MLKTLTEVLQPAQEGGYAVIAPDFFSLDFAQALLDCGEKYHAPLILSYYEWEGNVFELNSVEKSITIVRELCAAASIPVALHMDHAFSLDVIRRYLDLGFTSVMMDASKQDFQTNVEMTCATVDLARGYQASVEAELGHVGAVGESAAHTVLTDPAQAQAFVEQTGVDALAISIGTQHGIYNQSDGLHLDVLAAIRERVNIPLVLHGASGTALDQIHKAVEGGICKINLFSELFAAYMKAASVDIPKSHGQVGAYHARRRSALCEKLQPFLELSGSLGKG